MNQKSYWSQFTKPSCYPSHCNCEALTDSWIQQPSATISSLPLILLGLWIIYTSLRVDRKLICMGSSIVFLGLVSTAAHGTFTAFALHLDFLGILLCLSWVAIYCSGIPWEKNWIILWLILTLICFWITYLFEGYRIYFCIMYFLFVFILWIKWYKKNTLGKKDFVKAYSILAVSALLFYIDENKIWCTNPQSWLQGHTLWHIGVTCSLWYSFLGIKKCNYS